MKKSQVVSCLKSLLLALIGTGCSFQPGVIGMVDAPVAPVDDEIVVPAVCLDTVWCKRKVITVDSTQVTGAPAEFMLLVRVTNDAELAAGALPSGDDIRFAKVDGTPLPYEREAYDSQTGSLLAWVQVGGLELISELHLYYGNAAATDQQAGAAAWPGRYAAVWHLDEASGMLADATANANTAVPTNAPVLGATAVIGRGVTLDGTNDFLRVTKSASLDATTGDATFALWVNWDSLTSATYQRVLASENRFAANDDGYEWAAQPGGDFFLYPYGGEESYNLGPTPFTAGQWHHLVATIDFAMKEVRIFVDGAAMSFTIENDSTAWTMLGNPGDWLWGSNISTSGAFGGKMDEIQVMRGTRALGWIRAAYANQRADSTLLTIGPEQLLPPP